VKAQRNAGCFARMTTADRWHQRPSTCVYVVNGRRRASSIALVRNRIWCVRICSEIDCHHVCISWCPSVPESIACARLVAAPRHTWVALAVHVGSTCPQLVETEHIVAATCSDGNFYKSRCTYSCAVGYTATSPMAQCDDLGSWPGAGCQRT
jgi:hypothetical protein